MRQTSKVKNNFGFYAFFVFAMGFFIHTFIIYGYIRELFVYPAFLIYIIGAIIGIYAWIKHLNGIRMGYANMILASLSIMPLIIGVAIYIRLLIR